MEKPEKKITNCIPRQQDVVELLAHYFCRGWSHGYVYVTTLSGASYASVTSKLTPDSVVTYLFLWPVNVCDVFIETWLLVWLVRPSCQRLCRTLGTMTPDKLSAVSYDRLTHSGHNAGDRSVKVGHEISLWIIMSYKQFLPVWKNARLWQWAKWLIVMKPKCNFLIF